MHCGRTPLPTTCLLLINHLTTSNQIILDICAKRREIGPPKISCSHGWNGWMDGPIDERTTQNCTAGHRQMHRNSTFTPSCVRVLRTSVLSVPSPLQHKIVSNLSLISVAITLKAIYSMVMSLVPVTTDSAK